MSWLMPLAVLVSLLAVPTILFTRKHPNVRESMSFLAGAVKLTCVILLMRAYISGEVLYYKVLEFAPGVSLAFKADGLGLLFGFVAASLWMVTTAYSIGYMRRTNSTNLTRFYSFFAVSLAATMGVAFAANLFTLYLFYEALSLATFPLVTHNGDRDARSGGRRYLYFLLSTSIGLALPAMITVYAQAGTLEFSLNGLLHESTLSQGALLLLFLAFLFGFAKAAVMPFHAWLPGAMVAPTPVSALLHAVAVVKVGVFSILRVITGVFGMDLLSTLPWQDLIIWISSTTVILSSLIALSQDNLKRRLAYSTIGQLSYIVLGASLVTDRAVTGAGLHILMHAFGKITLFFCAGAIYVASGKKYISEMRGLGKVMPWTMTAFLLGSLSVIGVPPMGGFASKWMLLLGTVDSRQYVVIAVYLLSSLLNAAYFLPIVLKGFFAHDQLEKVPIQEAPMWCLVPLWITALVSVILFFASDFFVALMSQFLEVVPK
ncbi:MAG: monovalent cation/H+ antiporter subunit D family protein [Acidobacteria bacterium]|nr:monovalent cation/H+ antiporter subunit D family protein [Acidobacteriota bacterium]